MCRSVAVRCFVSEDISFYSTSSEFKCLRYLSPGAPEVGYLAQHQLLDQVNRRTILGTE
jgi:hypothetical protein